MDNQNNQQNPNQNFNPQFQQAQQTQQIVNQSLAEDKKKRNKKKLIIFLVILGIIFLIIIISALSGSSDENESTTAAQTTISANETTESKSNADGQIGDYICTIKSAEKCKDWSGKDAIKITYNFTNNSKDTESFDFALTDEAYQDGIQLETTFLDGGYDELGLDVKIKPGTTKEVSKIYVLRDDSTKIDIEISELISFSDDKLTYEIDL